MTNFESGFFVLFLNNKYMQSPTLADVKISLSLNKDKVSMVLEPNFLLFLWAWKIYSLACLFLPTFFLYSQDLIMIHFYKLSAVYGGIYVVFPVAANTISNNYKILAMNYGIFVRLIRSLFSYLCLAENTF